MSITPTTQNPIDQMNQMIAQLEQKVKDEKADAEAKLKSGNVQGAQNEESIIDAQEGFIDTFKAQLAELEKVYIQPQQSSN
jgi:hypothetical protein